MKKKATGSCENILKAKTSMEMKKNLEDKINFGGEEKNLNEEESNRIMRKYFKGENKYGDEKNLEDKINFGDEDNDLNKGDEDNDLNKGDEDNDLNKGDK